MHQKKKVIGMLGEMESNSVLVDMYVQFHSLEWSSTGLHHG